MSFTLPVWLLNHITPTQADKSHFILINWRLLNVHTPYIQEARNMTIPYEYYIHGQIFETQNNGNSMMFYLSSVQKDYSIHSLLRLLKCMFLCTLHIWSLQSKKEKTLFDSISASIKSKQPLKK